MYGSQTWKTGGIVIKRDKNRIQALKMWCWRELLRKTWMDRRRRCQGGKNNEEKFN